MNCLQNCLAVIAVVAVTHAVNVAGLTDGASPNASCDLGCFEETIVGDPRANEPPDVIIGLPREYGNAFRMDALA